MSNDQRTTLKTIHQWVRQGQRIPILTAYDATAARWLARGGVRVLLVGDTAAQMVLGFEQTTHAPLSFMITITAGVKRGAPDSFVIGDMPFMSYQADDAEAIHNAGRFITEGQADAVKLEVDESYAKLVTKLDRAGVPVVAHIGWRPQRMGRVGVPVVAGRTQRQIDTLVDLAMRIEQCGATMLLIEQSTAEASQQVVENVSVPVIGCGAGPACHGHVVVLQDWIGQTDWHPTFVKPIESGGQWLADLARQWVDLVQNGEYLKEDHPYKMNPKLSSTSASL